MSRNFAIAALACFFACFISLNFDVAFDGAESTLFGAPFPWNARSPAASLVKDVYLVPAVVNFAIFAFLASRLLRFGDRFGRLTPVVLDRTSFLLGSMALAFFAMTFMVNDTFVSLWPATWPKQILAVRLGWGA